MKPSLFITGASGFIGSHLLPLLEATTYQTIYCLSRNISPTLRIFAERYERLQLIQGDLCETEMYAAALAECQTVIHMAALTGKENRVEYFRVNDEGTRQLLACCHESSVANFLYISTIAVNYTDRSLYYYAQSKEAGEKAVQESSLNYAIVRPTIVVGQGAANLESMRKLVRSGLVVMIGNGTSRIQPIDVNDLALCLLTLLQEGDFRNEILEFGGPQTLTFGDFFRQIHETIYGKKCHMIYLPMQPLRAILSMLEKHFHSAMPITAGQLSAFSNPATIQPNRIAQAHAPQMMHVSEMLNQALLNGEQQLGGLNGKGN